MRQFAERAGWIDVAEYADQGISGAKGRDQRPQFDAMLKAATRQEFDLIAAWSIDRLGRSPQHLVDFLSDINAKGIDLYLHRQGLDTTTSSGGTMFGMLGVFAEFERAIIRKRINAGMQRAREKGARSGRAIGRPKVNGTTERRIRDLRTRGMSIQAIARKAGVGVETVQRIVREMADQG